MPFTFAHPAAVLPFVGRRRQGGWNAGLLAGALVPDLLRPLLSFNREITHSLVGWAFIDTPVSLLLAWILHTFLARRFHRLPGMGVRGENSARFHVFTAAIGAAIGGITHLLWDVFTHDQSPFTKGGILDHYLFYTPGGPFRLGQALWYVNTFVGILAIVGWLLLRASRSPGGLRSLVSWPWFRMILLPLVPFLWLAHGFVRTSGSFAKSVFLYAFYRGGESPMQLLSISAAVAVGVFLWETRLRVAAPSAPGPEPSPPDNPTGGRGRFLFASATAIVAIGYAWAGYTFLLDGAWLPVPEPKVIAIDSLPAPALNQTTLLEALRKRSSSRTFDPKPLDAQILSNLLWAANGINRPETGGRTAPSAYDWRYIDIYLADARGLGRYDATRHRVERLDGKDIRALTGMQDFVKDAPLTLVLVSDERKIGPKEPKESRTIYSDVAAGAVSQNVYLFCAASGLNVVVRSSIDRTAIHKALGLSRGEKVVVAQTIGYPP